MTLSQRFTSLATGLLLSAMPLCMAMAADSPPPAAAVTTAVELPLVKVYKSPTCGCCVKWIEHMEKAGFRVEATDLPDVNVIKNERGIAPRYASCHTAIAGDYVIEGHVPPADVLRLLREQPDVLGLAVPGMPAGSPGMEAPRAQPYDVLALKRDGDASVYSSYRP